MSRYVVRVIGPSGMERYLYRASREVESDGPATRYHHPSAAKAAGRSYEAKFKEPQFFWDVIDTRDPERRVE